MKQQSPTFICIRILNKGTTFCENISFRVRMRKYSLLFKIKLCLQYERQYPNVHLRSFCRANNVARTTFLYWLKKFRDNCDQVPHISGRPSILSKPLVRFIRNLVTTNPCIYGKEIVTKCKEHGFNLKLSSVYNILKKQLKFSHKKIKYFTCPAKKNLENEMRKIAQKQNELQKLGVNNVASIDEMPVYSEMNKPAVGGIKGKPLIMRKHSMRSTHYSLLLAMSSDGIVGFTLTTGGTNAKKFKTFLARQVLPNIRKNQILLMDNARIHHSKLINAYFKKKKQGTIFTVPYTPELNPVGNVFSVIKRRIRHSQPKNSYQMCKTLKTLLKRNTLNRSYSLYNGSMPDITQTMCINMFKKSFGLTPYKIER